jgi:putative ABC transport system permease protein
MREIVAESMVVAVAGGLAGTALSALAIGGLARVLTLDIVVHGSTLAWAIGSAAASGLVAGYYPARRATRIDVIAAVRAE